MGGIGQILDTQLLCLKRTSKQDYGAMQDAIAQVPNKPMLHNVKAPDLPASDASKVAQFRRVGKDLKNSWADVVRVLDTGTDTLFSTLAGPGFFNDFDMLEVGATNQDEGSGGVLEVLTFTEAKAHFSLWAAMKSPLVLGNDPRSMTPAVFEILSNAEVIAVNQDTLGMQAIPISYQAAASSSSPTSSPLLSSPLSSSSSSFSPCAVGNASAVAVGVCRPHNDLVAGGVPAADWEECCALCASGTFGTCEAWTINQEQSSNNPLCFLKDRPTDGEAGGECTSSPGPGPDPDPDPAPPPSSPAATKVSLEPCTAEGKARQLWTKHTTNTTNSTPSLTNTAGGGDADEDATATTTTATTIRLASDPSLCLAVYNCEAKWPCWIAVTPCASELEGNDDNNDGGNAACASGGQQAWAAATVAPSSASAAAATTSSSSSSSRRPSATLNTTATTTTTTSIEWTPTPSSAAGPNCWPVQGPGAGCCLSAEGSNPEVDKCGWPSDAAIQEWVWAPVESGAVFREKERGDEGGGKEEEEEEEGEKEDGRGQGVLDGNGAGEGGDGQAYTIASAHNGLCLTVAGGLQVFAAPLQQALGSGNPRATAVLLNRSPTTQTVQLRFADVAAAFGDLFPFVSDGSGGGDGSGGYQARKGRQGSGSGSSVVSVRDLWLHQDLGDFGGSVFEVPVESHAVVHVNFELLLVAATTETTASAP